MHQKESIGIPLVSVVEFTVAAIDRPQTCLAIVHLQFTSVHFSLLQVHFRSFMAFGVHLKFTYGTWSSFPFTFVHLGIRFLLSFYISVFYVTFGYENLFPFHFSNILIIISVLYISDIYIILISFLSYFSYLLYFYTFKNTILICNLYFYSLNLYYLY